MSSSEEEYTSDSESISSSTFSSTSGDPSKSCTLYVGKLPPVANETNLREHFTECHIVGLHVIRDKETKLPKGFAFIRLESEEAADRAVTMYHKTRLLGKHPIVVSKKIEKNSGKKERNGKKTRTRRRKREGSSSSVASDGAVKDADSREKSSHFRLRQHLATSGKYMSSGNVPPPPVPPHSHVPPPPVPPHSHGPRPPAPTGVPLLPSPTPVFTNFQPPRGHIHSRPPLPHPVPVPVPHRPVPVPHGPIPVPHGPIPVPHEPVPVSHGPVPVPHGPVPIPRKPVPVPRKPIPVPRKPAHVPHVPIPPSLVPPPSPDREGPVAVTLSNIPIEINEPDISDLVSRYSPCSLTVNSHFRTANIVLSSHQVASQVVRDLDGQTLLGSVITASISMGASHHGRRKSSTEARDSDSITINNLPAGTKRGEVMSHFASYGPIDKCFVKKQRQDSNTYYSIVKFKDPRAAINATTCDGSSFKGQPINVSLKEQQVSDNTNSIIIVSGLSSSTSDSDVFHSFKSYGRIIGKVKITESNPRSCSITYSSRESAERAVRELNHTLFKGSVLSVQHCNNDDNEDDDESDVLVSVGSRLESLLLSSPPPHSTRHRVITETKTMSSELYEFWMKNSESKLEDFKDSGGTIQYSEGVLSLSAASSENIESLIKDLSSYTERTLDCSVAQWNQLVLVDELGMCKMDQLKSPFSSLPDVMIVDKTPLKLSFIGRVTAVDSAYNHFFNELGKELTVDSFKIEALLELKDDLCDEILKKYRVRVHGFTLGSTKLIFEGNSSSLSLARSAVETTLASVKQSPLPSLPAPLMRSALSLCNKEGLNCTVLDHNNQSLLVCLSDDHLQKAERIFKRKPYTNSVRIFDADSYPVDLLSNIVKSESVQVELSEDSIFLKGFDKEEVQEARKEIEGFIRSAVKQEEVSCTPEQKAYIKKEFNSAELKSRFPNTVIRKDSICIQGSQEERRQSSMSLLGLVPPFCATVVLECDRRFLSLLEQQVMQPRGIEYIETSDGQRQHRGRGKGGGTRGGGGSNELKLFLYSSRSLDETVDELEGLSPCTLRVPVNPKAKDIVKKMKVDIERQCRCRLIINDHPNVLIHSLTKQESQRARSLILDEVKSKLIVFKYLPSPPIPVLHLKYLAEIYKDRFDEVSEGLMLFHWPKKRPFHAIGSEETDTIKVKGTGLQVDAVKEFLDEIINENEFCEKRFSLPITFPRYLLSMWRKRWNYLKTYFKERYEVFLEYKIPESVDAGSAIEFCVYGFNCEAVTLFENTVASEVSQKINTVEIPLPVERVNAVSTAIREHTLDFKDYSVDVFCNEKARKVVIRAPYFLKDDMDSVQDEIMIFLEATAISKEDVTLPDVPTYLLLTSKEHSYYQRAQGFARTVKVTFRPYRHGSVVGVTLNGTSGQIERFKLELDLIIKAVKSLLGCEYVSVDSLVLPCLTPTFCRDLNSKIEAQFMTVLNKESKSRPSSSQTGGWGGKWYWRDDDGSYIPHSASVCKELMSEYKANPKGIHVIIDYGKAIEVDFHSMIQTDLTTGIKRKVKCDSTAGSVQWYWTSDDGTKLVPYSAQESSDIENGFKVKQWSRFRMTINNRLYLIDTASMTQTNEETGNIRRIERRISSGGATQQTVIKLYGLKSQLAAARQHVEEKLSECLKTNEMTNPILKDPQFYQEVQKIASRHNVTLERQGSFSSSLEQKAGAAKPSPGLGRLFFKGVGFCINKVIQEVQERIIESRTATIATAGLPDMPQEWEAQETNLKLFPIQAHSDEYKRVEGLFKTTMPRSYVITIMRIQNMWLYEKYVQHRDRLALKNNGKSNECELFHGTRNTDPKEIFESEEGFDMRFSATGKWGQANYFAVNASYSDSYAHVNVSGYREMFLVKLLVGESYDSAPDSSLRMPPKMRVKRGELQTRYDTVTGMTGGSRVYMAYDNQKAYPAYLIIYTSY